MEDYTKDDIVRSYRMAKDKIKQITILAELTCSDTDTIIAILDDEGIFNGTHRVCTRCGMEYPALHRRGRSFCPRCRKKEHLISEKKYELKQVTAKIQQLGLESARIRAEIDRLEKTNDQK